MLRKLLFLSFVIIGQIYFSQQTFTGQILSENNKPISQVTVVNLTKSVSVFTDSNGMFTITANVTDEIRFVKKGFERSIVILDNKDFGQNYTTVLKPYVIAIEEVDLGKVMTGVLKKDVKNFTDKKTETLNTNLAIYMKTPMKKVIPKATIPKAFQQPKVNMIALDLVKTAQLISKLIKGESNLPPVFVPTELQFNQFYLDLKNDLGVAYFESLNIKEQDVDSFLRFAENKLNLCSRYFKNYNVNLIIMELEKIQTEFAIHKNA